MLLIPCPHCGERDENEFDYGGPAIDFPELSANTAEWHRAVHLPDLDECNLEEFWFHAAGCGCWIKTQRNIKTNEFQVFEQPNRGQS